MDYLTSIGTVRVSLFIMLARRSMLVANVKANLVFSFGGRLVLIMKQL
jgi:hypothetical protein